MDVSGSLRAHWKDEKTFVEKLAQAINISPAGGHAAVTIFSARSRKYRIRKDAELKIKFSDYTTFYNPDRPLNSFKEAVNTLPYWGGGTRIDSALNLALNEMFQTSNGMRQDVPKTCVLITDGKQSRRYTRRYARLARKFQKAKIRMIAVGVGKVNKRDLRKLVGSSSNLHLAKDFDALLKDSFIKRITVCNGT